MTLDASGVDDGSFYLPTPDNTGAAGANWFVTLPSGYEDIVTVAYSGAAQAVSDLLAAGATTADPDVITALVASKATKVSGATAGNLASLTSGGDLADSGAAAANVPTDDEKSWLTAGEAGGALGTAAYAATGDFDAAGSAAAAQAYAVQRANHTGTQLLATISDVTATGSSLAKAASVDAARNVIGLAAVALPPIIRNHHTMTWATSNVVGSFSASNYLNFCSLLVAGGTANSSGSIRVNDTALSLNYTAGTVNFARKINLSLYLRRGTANAQGVAYWTIGKVPSAAHGLVASGDYIGIKIENQTITSLVYCVSGTISTIAVSAAISAIGTMVFITSNNGSITWYADGAEIGSSASGPTANTYGTIFAEIQNGATAANYTMSIISSSEGF
jgi:hypothetical protein